LEEYKVKKQKDEETALKREEALKIIYAAKAREEEKR
jgi:hypothetical protein